ncbi:hypothetical protein SDC9_127175 [bioreactor metagenome]|uniref:Uncharacterized protein n=1 Tax=bioreactor metagenome TaxID=1076179 RepID=A0A645CTB1_9ZZZZ
MFIYSVTVQFLRIIIDNTLRDRNGQRFTFDAVEITVD